MSRKINLIIIHCSATRSNQRFTVDMLRACHNARFHGKGVGYHYYIERDGEGGLDEKGNSDDTRTPAQKATLIALLRSLKVDYPNAEIMGHCELEGVHKDCPSFSCQEYRDYFDKLAN